MLRPTLQFLALSGLLLVPTLASAQPRGDDTEAQHAQGNRLREQGRHAEARDLFRLLYARTQDPRALVRQGLAEMALTEWVPADEHLRAGLATQGNRWVDENRARIQGAFREVQTHVGSLQIECSPAGATVTVGGLPRGVCPLAQALRVLVGDVPVRVDAPGVAPLEQVAHIVAGDDPTVLRMSLVSALAPQPPSSDVVASNGRRRTMLVLGGVALGLGVAGLGVGAAGYLVEDNNRPLSTTMGAVGLTVGGALAITGVILLVAAPAHRSEGASAFMCAPTFADPGLACAMHF